MGRDVSPTSSARLERTEGAHVTLMAWALLTPRTVHSFRQHRFSRIGQQQPERTEVHPPYRTSDALRQMTHIFRRDESNAQMTPETHPKQPIRNPKQG
jgi:hypothetical protein